MPAEYCPKRVPVAWDCMGQAFLRRPMHKNGKTIHKALPFRNLQDEPGGTRTHDHWIKRPVPDYSRIRENATEQALTCMDNMGTRDRFVAFFARCIGRCMGQEQGSRKAARHSPGSKGSAASQVPFTCKGRSPTAPSCGGATQTNRTWVESKLPTSRRSGLVHPLLCVNERQYACLPSDLTLLVIRPRSAG